MSAWWSWLTGSGEATGQEAETSTDSKEEMDRKRRERYRQLYPPVSARGASGPSSDDQTGEGPSSTPAPVPAPASAQPQPSPEESQSTAPFPRVPLRRSDSGPVDKAPPAAGLTRSVSAGTTAASRRRVMRPKDPVRAVLEIRRGDDAASSAFPRIEDLEAKDDAGQLLPLSVDDVSIALPSRLMLAPEDMPPTYIGRAQNSMQYLGGCFARATNAASGRGAKGFEAALQAVQEQVVSSAASLVVDPTAFGGTLAAKDVGATLLDQLGEPGTAEFARKVLDAAAAESGADAAAFLSPHVAARLAALSPHDTDLAGAGPPTAQRLALLAAASPHVARALGLVLGRAPPASGRAVELHGLSPLLRASAMEDSAAARLFPDVLRLTQRGVDEARASTWTVLDGLHASGHALCLALLKAEPAAREAVLAWARQCLVGNAARTQSRPAWQSLASDAFMLNMQGVLLLLAEKFLDPRSPRSEKLNWLYLLADGALFPAEDPRLLPDAPTEALGGDGDLADFNFMTRCYMLCTRGLHVAVIPVLRRYMEENRHLQHLHSRLGDFRRAPENPQEAMMLQQVQILMRRRLAADLHLFHPAFLRRLLALCTLTAGLLRRKLGDGAAPRPGQHAPEAAAAGGRDGSGSGLPLRRPAETEVLVVPEHMLDDVVEVLLFVGRVRPEALDDTSTADLLDFLLAFLASPGTIRSPHLRAKLGEVLFEVFMDAPGRERPASALCSQLLLAHPRSVAHTLPALAELYGDVEQTGYYEKTMHRYRIMCIMQHLWQSPHHRAAFRGIAGDEEKFIKFANGILNHTNNLVTDALGKLPQIRETQQLMRNAEEWNALSADEREQRTTLLQENERGASGSLQLANETVKFISMMTADIREPLLGEELCKRVAQMLTSVLKALAGPRGVELKVEDPDKYNFNPRALLRDVTQSFVNLGPDPGFVRAVADSGYYSDAVMSKSASLLRRMALLPAPAIEAFEGFAKAVREGATALADEASLVDDAPDEYLDALMAELMKDPVRLPSSQVVVDRSTIAQHLLNDATDPFNRSPLSIEDVIPLPELKAEIEAWKAKHGISV